MNYCSDCGSHLLIFEVPKEDTLPRYQCKACCAIFYTNPKVIVGCIITYKNELLLCKRNIIPQRGFLTFPAGYMENHETIPQAAIRESKEEAGVSIDNPKLFATYSLPTNNQIFIVYQHEVANKQLDPFGHETQSVSWVALDEVDLDTLAFPVISESVRALREVWQTPFEAVIDGTSHHGYQITRR